jgi:hypothetical protein
MERKRTGRRKRSAFVPSVVFTTAVVGVVPACVVACGNGGGGGGPVLTVACSYAQCGVAAVAYVGYDSGSDASKDGASDAPHDAAPDGADGSDAPSFEGGVADAAFGSG